MTIPFTNLVKTLPDTVPFVGPETLERSNGRSFKARLGANESAFGISPLAQEAIQKMAGVQGCSWYGDPENYILRSLLADRHQVQMNNICVDAGIDSLLGLTIRLFVEHGDVVVTSDGAYPTVNYHVNAFGGVVKKVPYKNNHEDPVALLEAAKKFSARLIYLANPDNPMGTSLEASAVQVLIDGLPQDCLLMLDEAYIEFMTHRPSLPLAINNAQVLRFRTFSKAYGMAGMRIGYVLAHHDIVNGYNRIRNHFGVPRLSQIAAEASLQDNDYLQNVQDLVEQGRQRIYQLADSLGFPCIQSATNFVAVDIGDAERAMKLIQLLCDEGVFMRKPMVPPQDSFIRIGVGTEAEHAYMERSLKRSL